METVQFADLETLLARIQESDLALEHPADDVMRAARAYATKQANQRRNAMGAALGYGLAIHPIATAPGNHPLIYGMLRMMFEDILSILLPDETEFVKEAVEFFNEEG